MKLFEAVPNFSEGRDGAKVDRIAQAGRSVSGVALLDVESDPAHHRSVLSLAGAGPPLVEALVRMSRVALEVIDLNHHVGEHPRMGAVDVVPIVPLGEATMAEAVALSEQLAQRVWTELGIPVYLYAASARRPERSDLAKLRRGEFEGIRAEIATNPDRAPDFGSAQVHPTAGIVAIGARPILIAFNAYLATPDVGIAKQIAHSVRERDGGLPAVKALGFTIEGRGQAQVSMNLVDYHMTPIHAALEAVRAEAGRRGTKVVASEVVGLVPTDALVDAAEHYLELEKFDRTALLERRLERLERLDQGTPSGADAPLRENSLSEFSDRVAARTPTPGGGSVSAAAGAFGAALGVMVLRYSRPAEGPDPELDEGIAELDRARSRLLELVDADAASYEAVRSARKARKARPEDVEARQAHRAALRTATEVPLETARVARGAADLLDRVRGRVKPAILSDLVTGSALLRASVVGAAANVRVNLKDLALEGIDPRGLEQELASVTEGLP
ncbi:MAG TPA: glutamate formimidoyltransferase [Thermoplasmata archaeon]|nr:glutamate formimidoyltransferase [Thermoplasmata archaeon]